MWKSFRPHLFAFLALFVLNAIYFYPAYSGKKIEQDDIQLGLAKSKEIRDYRESEGEEPLWTNSMFSGMPAFQVNMDYPNNIFEKVEAATKLYQPASIGLILFLMLGFYFLLASYKVDPRIGAIAALAFGFSAFFIISFDAGHNAKLRAAGYFAPTLMGVLLAFRGRYMLGLAFTALFAGMAVSANHIQITYYSVIVILIITIVEAINALKNKRLPAFFKSIGVLSLAAVLALGPNVSKLWTTYEYTQESMRGGGSGLKAEENEDVGGLDKDYAMNWSYGTVETLNLIVPNIMGGGVSQNYEGTEVHDQFFKNIKRNLQQQGYSSSLAERQANRQIASLFYWGDQTMVNGANYLGASVFFLFVLGLFLIRDRRRTWIVAATVIALFMAWGKNFSAFNDILFEYFPLYNKFRVPSMTLTVVFVMTPLLGGLALNRLLKNNLTQTEVKKALLKSLYVTGGLFLLLALLGPALFDFSGPGDERYAQNPQLLDQLIEDRKDLARSSAFRSLIFTAITFGLLYLWQNKVMKTNLALLGIGAVVLIDLWSFDKQHLNKEDFVEPKDYLASYEVTTADRSILQDTSYYRVFNLQNPFNDAATSFHHKSIGGYHGAKLQRYQELYEEVLFEEQQAIVQSLQENQASNIQQTFAQSSVLNMLNGKYVIYNPQARALTNQSANGPAWFVEQVQIKPTSRAILNGLKTVNTKRTALVHQNFAEYLGKKVYSAQGDIEFVSYNPKRLVYRSSSSSEQFAVFSEIYYRGEQNDWQATIDGEPAPHIRVNHVLRALKIPAGQHEIVFEFKPRAFYAGETISLISSILLALVFFGSLFFYFRKDKKEPAPKKP